MKLPNLHRSQHGDTIIEVLVVLAVLSLAIVTSISIATKSLGQARNSEEHSETLGSINSQVEWLRTATKEGIALPVNTPFCMTGPTTFNSSFPADNKVAQGVVLDDFTKYPASCTQGEYHASIIYGGDTTGSFDVRLRWDGAGDLGRQQEQLNFRTYKLDANASNGTGNLGSQPASITVNVRRIEPNTGPIGPTQPSCTKAPGSTPKSGVTMTLTQTNGGSGTPQSASTISSVAAFTNLTDSGVYTLSVTGVPAGYELCPSQSLPATKSGIAVGVGGQIVVNDFSIRPQCHTENYTTAAYPHSLGTYGDYLGTYGDYQGTYGDYLGTYSDYIGTYGDPYQVNWWEHTGGGVYPIPGSPNDFYWWEGSEYVHYAKLNPPNGTYYNRFVYRTGTAYTAAYDHYGTAYAHYGGAYAHYSAAYAHYSAPYEHFSAPYGDPATKSVCTETP